MCGLTKNKGGLDGAKWIFAYICRIFVIGNAIIHFIACQLISSTTDFKKKRLEYEAREKAIRDHNTQMYSAEQRGMQRGIEITRRILKLKTEGKSAEQIAEKCDLPLEQIKEIMEW